jgi:hypothetical protein
MTNMELTLHLETLLALRARLQGDVTQMEDYALNEDHNKTASIRLPWQDWRHDRPQRCCHSGYGHPSGQA